MNPKQSFIQKLIGKVKSSIAPDVYIAKTESPTYEIKDRGVKLNEEDLALLRKVLFSEVSNRNPNRQDFESRIIANTALNRIPQYAERGGPTTLSGVLTMPNQYQGYGSKEYERISNNATTSVDAPKLTAVDNVINDIKAGKLQDNTGGNVFYQHDPAGKIWVKGGKLYR